MDPITVVIGGEAIALPPITNFAQMNRIWADVLAVDAAGADALEGPVARLRLIANILVETRPDLTFDVLEGRLRIHLFDGTGETAGLYEPVRRFEVASSFLPDAGAEPVIPPMAAEPEPGAPIVVVIGGERLTLPPIGNLKQMARIWPAMKAMDASDDIVRKTAARLALIAGVLAETRPDLTLPELEKRLRPQLYDGTGEIWGLIEPVHRFLVASGLVAAGEAKPPETPAAEPSNQTGTT